MKIGIYGGTFNPIHYGHLRTAEDVADRLSLDRMLFIPAGLTPFDKPDLEKAAHRYAMVRAAIQENPRFAISRIEVNSRGRSYTVDTLRRLRLRYKKSDFYLVLGIDAFLDLPLWKQPDRIVRLASVVIISRPGYRFVDLSDSPYMQGVSRKTLRDLDSGRAAESEFAISGGKSGILCRVKDVHISATDVRSAIRAGKNVSSLLPDSVKSYIIASSLYRPK